MTLRARAGFVTFVLALAACGTSSSSGGTSSGAANDAGNPPGCPADAPSNNSACADEGLGCSFGSGCSTAQAKCHAGVWTVDTAGCAADPCTSAGGSCTCGPAPVGYVATSIGCPPTPGPGCVQTCYMRSTDGGTDSGPGDAGSFACGDKTCGPGQLCSDTNVPNHMDGGAVQLYECRDLPAACVSNPTCACVACNPCNEANGHVTCVSLAP